MVGRLVSYCEGNFLGANCLTSRGMPCTTKFGKKKPDLLLVGLEFLYLGVSKDRDTPKWMVYNGKPY